MTPWSNLSLYSDDKVSHAATTLGLVDYGGSKDKEKRRRDLKKATKCKEKGNQIQQPFKINSNR